MSLEVVREPQKVQCSHPKLRSEVASVPPPLSLRPVAIQLDAPEGIDGLPRFLRKSGNQSLS